MKGDNKAGFIGPEKGVLTIGTGVNGLSVGYDLSSVIEREKVAEQRKRDAP